MVLAHVHTQDATSIIFDSIHVWLAIAIFACYLAIPFTALRRLPLPRLTRLAGIGFFITCALTHLMTALDLAHSRWMIASDAVQLLCVAVFIISLSRMVATVMDRSESRSREASHDRGGPS